MAVSRGERLKKQAAKAQKRKAALASKAAEQRRLASVSSPRSLDFAKSPIVACTLTPEDEGHDERTLFLCRRLSAGRYAACFYDIDLWCMGVLEADFLLMDAETFDSYVEGADVDLPLVPLEPADARQLLRDAAAYGAANGFPPPEHFEEIESMFGDIAPSGAAFELGRGGQPHYVPSPDDSPARVQLTLKQLERSLGPGGFKVTLPEGEEGGL